MNIQSITITTEKPEQYDAVEQLAEVAFGPGRFTRTAFRLREGVPHIDSLSFVACLGKELTGYVRLTPIKIGNHQSLVLGPLVVAPAFKSCGIGKRLMEKSVQAARAHGETSILLVGDEPYYGQFGFEQVPAGSIQMPGPVDKARLLICHLQGTPEVPIEGEARSI